MAGAVEARGEQLFGQREADRVREALAERAGGGLHAGRVADLGMARGPGMQLPETAQLLHRQVVAREVQQGVLEHRAVAVGEHEAVAIGPGGVRGVVAQEAAPEYLGDLGHAHRHARMARVGLLHRVHRQGADGVDDLGLRGDGNGGGDLGHRLDSNGGSWLGSCAKTVENAFVRINIGLYLRTFSPRYFSLG
jgi:hypothetical protein